MYNAPVKRIVYKRASQHELIRIEKPKPGCWIDISNATNTDIMDISTLTGLTYADLDDALDPLETPRIEYEEHAVLIFLRIPK